MTVIPSRPIHSYHSYDKTKEIFASRKCTNSGYDSGYQTPASCAKSTCLRDTINRQNDSCILSRNTAGNRVERTFKSRTNLSNVSAAVSCFDSKHTRAVDVKLPSKDCSAKCQYQKQDFERFENGVKCFKDFHKEVPDKCISGKMFQTGYSEKRPWNTGFDTGVLYSTAFDILVVFRIDFCTCVIFYTKFGVSLSFTGVCTWVRVSTEVRSGKILPGLCDKSEVCNRVINRMVQCSCKYRTVGRRKEGEQKNGKQKKNESGSYGRKSENGRSRRTSQGNGSSGMEGSGEGSGNGEGSGKGDDSSDDDDDDDDDQDDEDDDDEEEGDDEDEIDTDNVSAMAEDEAEETTNGGEEMLGNCGKVTSTTLEIHTTGLKDDVANDNDQNAVTSLIAPAEPGTPVTLSGVIWKETMGGVLVVNLKWRNKTYSGSLIDHSRYGWANPRNLEESQECDLSSTSRKGKRGKHKESAYTGNPLSPKMSGKRSSRFHRNKGKHNKESSTKSKAKRGSDTTEEGTRTRRRSCTVKTSVSPSPSPTPLIECPERNCNKRYKHINGLRYHQAHAHLDNADDGDDKDSYDEDDMKSLDLKEPLSANSKSSGSDDVKPLSHRKAKSQKANSKTSSEVSLPDETVQNGEKLVVKEEPLDKYEDVDIKTEARYDVTAEPEPMKVEESPATTKPNILEEAVKVLFAEPAVSQDPIASSGIFSRMTSQAILAASHPPEYKYVDYEQMDEETVGEYGEKFETSGVAQEMDVTVKEEVIDEGHAGVAKILSCKDESTETFQLEKAELRFNGAKATELTAEDAPKCTEDDKTKWLPEKSGKPRKGDVVSVSKEQIKTSAAEIRSLPGYKHFRLPPNNNSAFLTQPRSLTLDTGLLDSKDPQKGGMPKDAPRQERAGDKSDGTMVWKMQGVPLASSASFQLTCESKGRPTYLNASRVTTSTWVPEVHPAVLNKMTGGGVPGQEVLPEKPLLPPREIPEALSPRAHETAEEQDNERTKMEKGDDERSKGTYSGKPARAVGVAHPFNAEKSEGEFALGTVGNITTDPVRVLYSKSSSPKTSVDHTHPDMTEVKKVRVEKTLEVPVGEVVPLSKTSRSAVTMTTARGSVMVGTGNLSEVRVSVADDPRVPRIIAPSPPPRDPQQTYTPSSGERSSPWRPGGGVSPSRDHEPRSRSDTGQHYTSTESNSSRKPFRRSPVPDHRSPPFKGSYLSADIGRKTPEKDAADRFPYRDKRLPFRNMDERLTPKDSSKGVIEIAHRNSPGKDIQGSLHPPRSDSPRKDTPSTFHRLTTGYRDSERSSPYGDSRRHYDKSPIRDRRSPAHQRRSPEMVERGIFLDTSPKPMMDPTRHSPYRERTVKQTGESALASPRKASRSPGGESRTAEVSRGYRTKPEVLTSKETGDSVGLQRTIQENRFQRMSEDEALLTAARIYQYQAAAASSQDPAAMENYMMYLRMSFGPGFDPRLMPPYSMMTAAQMPFSMLQTAKENTASKDEKPKEVPDDIRRKTSIQKTDALRSRLETSETEMLAGKRNAERMSSSREKTGYESASIKRTKVAEMKGVHEIIDEKEGERMHLRTLEQRALQQAIQHKMDACILQAEKNPKIKAELNRSKPPSSSNTSRLKQASQESRTMTKREDKRYSKDEKSRISPASISSHASGNDSSMTARTRNPDSKSSVQSSGTPYLDFVSAQSLPANHALSSSYEQALAMQGYPPYIMPSPFHFAPGIMMANPALVPGSQLHDAVTARGLDPKRDPTRSTSSSNDRARPRDEEENDSRGESREFSSKKEVPTMPRINPPTPPPTDKDRPKEKSRGDHEEGKQRSKDSLHGSQSLPANLTYRRGDMSGGVLDQAQFAQVFPGMMYPGAQGAYRQPYDHPFIPHPRK
ncbi:uncharacterized protein LOC114522568 isoform X2 [Dendronephthya gigantea]|uniref:uncharacterized protein LOC114522568 isoform X2 n=1 Tax=Dendronephthya gigantea TaxID=151771 RepID=UPI00106BE034|nr:uncharacterized protein LOC114522568 isoform X2 [Dendronephthya gigantea]